MKILLTGATGFIGSYTARALLADGHEVIALVRPASNLWRIMEIRSQLHFVEGDLLDPKMRLPSTKFDLCVHCAWFVEPSKYLESPWNQDHFEAGLRLAHSLLEAHCPKLLVTGTCFEYDLVHALKFRQPIKETSPTGPWTRYGKSKLALLHSLQQLPIDLTWTRIFYQYGLMEDSRRLVPEIINQLLRGQPSRPLSMHQVRDFLNAADVGTALAALVKANVKGVVNIGSNRPVTNLEIGEMIGRLMSLSNLIEINLGADPQFVVADNERLRRTGWVPKINLETGLRQTIEWWKTQSAPGK